MAAKILNFSGAKFAHGSSLMRKTKKKRSRSKKVSETLRSSDVPVTRSMLFEAVYELKHEIRESELRTEAHFKGVDARFNSFEARFSSIDERFEQMESRFAQIDSRFEQMEARFAQIDSRFEQMEARFAQIDSRFAQMDARFDRLEAAVLDVKADIQKLLSVVHNIALRVEEQNARNIYVLDGHTNLNDRVDLLEKEVFGKG